MDAAEVTRAAFWASRAGRMLVPPRLEREGAELERLLGQRSLIVFATSGSGGTPKWVGLRREALVASAEAVNAHLAVTANDIWMLALPLYHVGGFGVAARAYAAGCGLKRIAGKWNAMRFADELGEAGATLTSLVPAQVHDLVACGLRAPESLRAVVVGGGRLDEIEGQEARELGWPLLQSYGMTEAASQIATAALDSLEDDFLAAPLPVLPHWECRVGAGGRLQLRGRALFEAYLDRRDGALVEARPVDAEGWFRTSDLGELSAAGLTVTGRADRQVKILGELVDVQALEDELRSHTADGTEVQIVPVPDDRRGWRLVPVLGRAGAEAADLVEALNERLDGFARLDPPRLLEQLPRTPLGKVDADRLRAEIGLAESS